MQDRPFWTEILMIFDRESFFRKSTHIHHNLKWYFKKAIYVRNVCKLPKIINLEFVHFMFSQIKQEICKILRNSFRFKRKKRKPRL